MKGQAIGCFEVGTRYENKHLPCCNTMFQQSEHKEEQKEHKEEQRWEEEEPRTRGRESSRSILGNQDLSAAPSHGGGPLSGERLWAT